MDEVWAVFDRDEHPRFDEAIDTCSGSSVRVARSNPCFEVWLILHFVAYNRPDGRHEVQKHLEILHSAYKSGGSKSVNCSLLIASLSDAEARSARQLQRREEEGQAFSAPSTTVHELVASIRRAAKRTRV